MVVMVGLLVLGVGGGKEGFQEGFGRARVLRGSGNVSTARCNWN